jgi:FKBP-type peptidyl-prolyl cis-trans isomerase
MAPTDTTRSEPSVAGISKRDFVLVSASLMACPPVLAKEPEDERARRGRTEREEDELPIIKLPNGVKMQVVSTGNGSVVAARGDFVLFDYVLRRSNGYFIYSTQEGVSFQPRDVPVGPVGFELGSGQLVKGLEDGIIGMAIGAKRRILVPAELGYSDDVDHLEPQPPTYSTKRQLLNHYKEPLLFEVRVLRVNP